MTKYSAPWLGDILHEEWVSSDRDPRGCSEHSLQGCLLSGVLCVRLKEELVMLWKSLNSKCRWHSSVFNLMPDSSCKCMHLSITLCLKSCGQAGGVWELPGTHVVVLRMCRRLDFPAVVALELVAACSSHACSRCSWGRCSWGLWHSNTSWGCSRPCASPLDVWAGPWLPTRTKCWVGRKGCTQAEFRYLVASD